MLNRCEFIGNLGQDPETRYTQNGVQVTTFSIAVSEKWKDQEGNQQESTEWIRLVAWKRLSEICSEYLAKGSKVFVAGKMQTRKWQDQNGNDRYTTEITIREMEMLSSRQDERGNNPTDEGRREGGGGYPGDGGSVGEDVPF